MHVTVANCIERPPSAVSANAVAGMCNVCPSHGAGVVPFSSLVLLEGPPPRHGENWLVRGGGGGGVVRAPPKEGVGSRKGALVTGQFQEANPKPLTHQLRREAARKIFFFKKNFPHDTYLKMISALWGAKGLERAPPPPPRKPIFPQPKRRAWPPRIRFAAALVAPPISPGLKVARYTIPGTGRKYAPRVWPRLAGSHLRGCANSVVRGRTSVPIGG